MFKRDPTEITDEERQKLLTEFEKFRGPERRRQAKAALAVLAAVGTVLILGIPMLLFARGARGFIYFLVIPLGAGAAVYKALYPKDFWGR